MRKKLSFKQITRLFSKPDGPTAEEFRFARPFFILVIAVLMFIYVLAIRAQPGLQTIWPFIGFTFLMALHIILHWQSIVLIQHPGWEVRYVLLQSVIALLIVYMLNNIELAFGVIAAMIGETIGILRDRRKMAALVVLLLLAGTFGVIQLSGQNAPIVPWFIIIPIVLFIVFYVEMYSRQDEARQEAQSLLNELESAYKELSQYASQVEELTLHAERERMAFELHDTLGQGVAGIVLQLEAVKNHLENKRIGRAEEIVTQAMHRARTTLEESRAVIDNLRQMERGQVSFQDMLMQQIEDFKQSRKATIEINIDDITQDFEPSNLIIEHTKRIISEALFNIVQHAQAANVSLTARGSAEELWIEIKDDGKGFDLDNIGQDGHYGLVGMQERAQQLGGACDVFSQPNQGTSIKVVIPLTTKERKNV